MQPAAQILDRPTFAPPQPDTGPDVAFEDRLKKEVGGYYDLTKTSRSRRYYIQLIADCFARGLHWISYDKRSAVITEWSQEDMDACRYVPVPLLQDAVTDIAAQYATSNGKPVASSPAKDTKTKAVLRAVQDYAEFLDYDFFQADPDQRQTEAMLIPLRGVYNYLEYDFSQGEEYELPQYEPQQQLMCVDCGYPVPEETPEGTEHQEMATALSGQPEAPPPAMCLECGSTNVEPRTVGIVNKGNVKARQGKVVRHVVDSFQVEIFDRRRDIEQSPYLFYDDIMFTCEAKKEVPWVKIDGKASLGNWHEGFVGLHYLHQLQTLVANTGKVDQSRPDYTTGYGGAYLQELLCWRRRIFLDTVVYADWVATRDTELPGPEGKRQTVPKGTPWIQVFPDGLVIWQINNGPYCKYENRDKNKVWSGCKYRPATAGLFGPGVSSLVSQNRLYDELTSFQVQATLMNALGINLVDERVTQFANIPGQYYQVPVDARAFGESLQSLVEHIDTGGPSSGGEMLRQSVRDNFADLSQARDTNNGAVTERGMKTATGVRYRESVADTKIAPPLELYANHRCKVVAQAIELERENNIKPRLYTKFNTTIMQWFEPMEIPEGLKVAPAIDSWQPKTMETKRGDFAGGVGLGIGTGSLAPDIEEQGRRIFGLDAGYDDYEEWAVIGEKRVDRMIEVLPLVMQELQQMQMAGGLGQPPEGFEGEEEQEQPGQPQQMAEQGPDAEVEPELDLAGAAVARVIDLAQAAPFPMDAHPHFVRYYVTEHYVTDKWDAYPPILQQAILMVWMGHNAEVQMQMAEQAALEAGPQENEDETAAREEDGKKKDHSRAVDLQNRKHRQAKELEGVKAKNRPKSAAKAKARR